MSTLAELETAVYQLPLAEQEILLRHLLMKVRSQRPALPRGEVENWMNRLDGLRASVGTGRVTLTSETILDESREERN